MHRHTDTGAQNTIEVLSYVSGSDYMANHSIVYGGFRMPLNLAPKQLLEPAGDPLPGTHHKVAITKWPLSLD